MPALFYFHVAKTAGHSLINEIRQHFAPSQILTERGRVTVPFLQAYGGERLRDIGFIYGHTGTGAAAYLQGIADTILLLRDPLDHLISNYLHMARALAEPWHHAAAELGIRDFIHTYPGVLAFQTISLANGLGNVVSPEHPYNCLPDMVRYLESTFLLGTVDQIDELMASLARVRQWPAPVLVRRLNTVPPGQAVGREEFEDAYMAMAASTHYGAALIAVEQAVYAAAKRVAATQREQRSLNVLGETARRVWRSTTGEIVLGNNFGRREMIDGEPAWWTLEANESHIHVSCRMAATLCADIRVWHAVDPTCIQLWMDWRKLETRIEQTCDGHHTLIVPLADLVGEALATIALRFVPRNPPTDPPWHPALLLCRFRLVTGTTVVPTGTLRVIDDARRVGLPD